MYFKYFNINLRKFSKRRDQFHHAIIQVLFVSLFIYKTTAYSVGNAVQDG